MTKIEAIEFFVNKETQSSAETEAVKLAIVALAQPERPKGEWIRPDRWDANYWECSYCHVHEPHISLLYFCPRCGADMRSNK